MLSVKAALHSEFYAWKNARICHLFAFILVVLLYPQNCESSSLFAAMNSSSIHSPLEIASQILTSTLSDVTHGQTLLSTHEQSSRQYSLETSKFGVHTGNDQTLGSTAEVLSSESSLKLHVATTKERYSVEKALQTENRKTESTRRTEDAPLQITQLSTETVSSEAVNTSFTRHKNSELLRSAFDKSVASNTDVMSPHFRFSLVCSTESNMAISTTKSLIALSSSSASKTGTFTTDTAGDSSVLFPYITNMPSNGHIGKSPRNSYDITPGEDLSKSTFLSHYPTGILTQVPGFSSTSMQLPLKVSSTFTSPSAVPILTTTVRPTIAQISTTLVSSTSTTRASSSFATSSVARMSTSLTNSAVARVSSLPASSSTVKINTKSTSSTPHVLFSRATTTSSLAQITSVQPMLSSSVPTQKKDTLRCKINNSTCICFNCEEALKNGKICCIDQIDNKNIQHGVTMNVTNITVKDFYSKVEAVSRIIGEVVRDSCRENASPCVTGKRFSHTRGKRRRRSPEENILKNYPSFDVVRTKREALSPDETPSMTNISHVDVIICGISSKAGHPSNVQTDFYVTVTSLNNGTNQTAVIDGKGLLQILRDNKRTLEDKLNITIDSFAASQKPEKRATTTSPHRTLVPNPSSGSPNMQSPSSSLEVAAVPTTAVDGRSVEDGKKQGISQGLLILIICVGCAGVVLMIVVMAFILTRFYKQRKGEFVPDKSYPNSHNKQNGNVSMEDAETYSTSIIDPSTPRITDVPHKPTRAQAAWGGAGGAKKQKKPMGVKVTYKPPEWD